MSEASLCLFKSDSNLGLWTSSNISEQRTGTNTSIDETRVILGFYQRKIQRGPGIPLNLYY